MRKGLFFLALLLSGYQSFATRYYVNAAAAGSNNGLSWNNAFTSLQSALSAAIGGDEIWVAAGVYKPTSGSSRSTSFVMKNGVNVYGGFSGTETSLAQRDIATAPTTLSGDINETGDNSDNSYKIVKIQNFTSNFTLDGFIVSSGYDAGENGKGAGIFMGNNGAGTINIKNCVFYNNYAYHSGGAILVDVTNVTFDHCDFLYNSSYNYGGGAVYSANVSSSSIVFKDCRFTGNSSRSGAVIEFDGTSLVFDRCIISSNSATSYHIISADATNLFRIMNSLIVGNVNTNSQGTVIATWDSGLTNFIYNSTIAHNRNSSAQTPWHVPIYAPNGGLQMRNTIAYENSSESTAQMTAQMGISYCVLSGTYATGTANIFANPMFASPATLAAAPFEASGYDYSLASGSPGINSGNNALVEAQYNLDVLGSARLQDGVVDRGAYESALLGTIGYPETIGNGLLYDASNHIIRIRDVGAFEGKSLQISDLNGKTVHTAASLSPEMPLSLEQGIYIVRVGQVAKKIIVR